MIKDEYIKSIEKHQQITPVNIKELANELKLAIEYHNFTDNVSGAIVNKNNNFIIYVNENHNNNRKRFTIAHEIAHYILHEKEIGDSLADDALYRSRLNQKSNVYERQANRLAAEILVPIKLLMKYLTDENIKDIQILAKKFEVSKTTMELRISEGGNIFLP